MTNHVEDSHYVTPFQGEYFYELQKIFAFKATGKHGNAGMERSA